MHEETYWQAVMTRDSRSNGTFVYGVRSTGIYCNPSCPSRRPQREQVVFFPLPEAAERAGFRPCRRCHPQETEGSDPQVELVRSACRYIEQHLENPPGLSELSEHVHLSPFHLQRVFKRLMGISPRQYAEAYRLGQFKAQLKEGESVTNALYDVGYGSSSRILIYPWIFRPRPFNGASGKHCRLFPTGVRALTAKWLKLLALRRPLAPLPVPALPTPCPW